MQFLVQIASLKWYHTRENFVLRHKYLRYLYQTRINVFIIIFAIEWAKYKLFSTIISWIGSFAYVIILQPAMWALAAE